MSGEGTPQPGQNGVDTQSARIQVIGQYVKDLSFENPSAPASFSLRPEIDLSVDLQARQVERDHYEVELRLRVSAKAEDKPVFMLELVYAGLMHLQNIPDEIRQQVLLIEGPHILFPFARRIVADTVRDGGLPPLMIEPIDFGALFRARVQEVAQERAAPPDA